ncbi:MAG TPA: DUF4126 domain-containing protein [Anaerolineae bacterium]|nr:DUF4126 domain-containing protein [Anaerolineae bacterium]
MIDLLSAFGLSSAAGLNAYLPLLIVGLLARFTDFITLNKPWDLLENPWILGLLAILLVIEMTADKIPAVDTINDAIQSFIRPTAGAILFASSSNIISDMSPILALAVGLLAAGGMHAVKATARPVVTTTTAGVGNPVVSFIEDIIAALMTLIAILLPAIAAFIVLVVGFFIGRWFWRRRARHAATTS